VETIGQHGVQEGGEEGGFEAVDRVPDRIRDVVGTRGGGVRVFGKGSQYFLRGEGDIVLVAYEAEEWGRRGLGRAKVMKECFCYHRWVSGPRQIREPLRRAGKRKPFGRPEGVCGGR